MCENLRYESVNFKELHNEQEHYWPTIYRTGAAVVSTITSLYVIFHVKRTKNNISREIRLTRERPELLPSFFCTQFSME